MARVRVWHFSWVDHRLVREHYIEKADVCAWSLYLFLITVADARGLSYHGEASLCRRPRLDPLRLARRPPGFDRPGPGGLRPTLYQVLSFPEPETTHLARLRAVLEARS